MTNEELIERLKRIADSTDGVPAVEEEVAEIDATIEEYNEQIAALEAKLADMSNYQYKPAYELDRELTEELLEESFAEQLEQLDREDQEYREIQELGIRVSESYDEEIATLNDDIAALERRLRKNELAVSKGLRGQLPEEEVAELTNALENKRARLAQCLEFRPGLESELEDYSQLLVANSQKREILLAKQAKLAALKEDRLSHDNTIDTHKVRLDKDELARLKAGVEALRARKDYIINNPQNKIQEEINALVFALEKEKETAIEEPVVEKEKKETDEVVVTPVIPVSGDIYDDLEDEPDYEASFVEPSDLDEERKAEIEDTKEELLEKKRWPKVKEFFKRHKRKFIAAGLAVILIASIKGCSNVKNVNQVPVDDTTISTEYEEEEKDKEFEDVGSETPDSETDEKDESDLEGDTEPDPDVDTDEGLEDDLEDGKDESDLKGDTEPDLDEDLEDEKDESDLEGDTEPDLDEDLEDEKKTIELDAGESAANISDIVEGEKVKHGDEVGKKLDSGVEIKDYTEEGKAVVKLPTDSEVEKKAETEVAVDKTFHETLEDFFGGPISITDAENSYETGEEFTSSKSR